MKEILKIFTIQGLTGKQKLIALYFIMSFCFMFISDETPLWIVILLLLNFANAVRLLRTVPVPKIN